ncbi:MAG: hypothetical protein C5S40_00510 [ANME-2 cluster archaeon]|nr:hypothetical protein [ANME-2 cluster archaeon]
MVAGLIAMGILTNQPGDITLVSPCHFHPGIEHFVKLFSEFHRTSQEIHHSANILWNEESILPRIGLGEHEVHFCRIERRNPSTIQTATHESCFCVKNIFIILCPLDIVLIVIFVSQIFCHDGNTPIVIGIFQCFRDR